MRKTLAIALILCGVATGCKDLNVGEAKHCQTFCACKTSNQGCVCGAEKGDCKCEACACKAVDAHHDVTVQDK